jgi:hypothetical protein
MIFIKVEKMLLRSCGNTGDPHCPDLKDFARSSIYETEEQRRERRSDWLSDKVLGDPQPNKNLTIQQMKDNHMVGVYSLTIDDFARQHPELVVEYSGWLELPPFPL